VGQGGETAIGFPAGERPQLEPPPGAPIRTAWIAGRIGLAFVDEQNAGVFGDADQLGAARNISLTALESLDVEQRPYIWDL